MNRKLLLSFLALFPFLLIAQTKEEQALEKMREAVKVMDAGNLDESIKMLEEAKKLDPKNIDITYETGFAYYMKQDYKKSISLLEKVIKDPSAQDNTYELLGNAYDMAQKRDKAEAVYKAGLERFPNSGRLYLEIGVVKMASEKYDEALENFEKGIEVDPTFPSNYYWAAKLFCLATDEEAWGMMYGEIFMNLEIDSKRNKEMSKILYDTYNSEIKFTSDSTMSVSFTKSATISVDQLMGGGELVMPFASGAYEMGIVMAMVGEKSVSLASLSRMRSRFINSFYTGKNADKYDNVLFRFEKKVADAGHMEAYTHWLLRDGNPNDFKVWREKNTKLWEDFTNWYGQNNLEVNLDNEFVRVKMP